MRSFSIIIEMAPCDLSELCAKAVALRDSNPDALVSLRYRHVDIPLLDDDEPDDLVYQLSRRKRDSRS